MCLVLSIVSNGQYYRKGKTASSGGGTPPSGSIVLADTLGYASQWDGTITQSFTVSNTSNRYMLVFGSGADNVKPDSAYYGTQKMTYIDSSIISGVAIRADAFGLVAPTIGTANLVLYYSQSQLRSMMIKVFSGVNQTTPHGTPEKSNSVWGSILSSTVTSATNEVVTDFVVSVYVSGVLYTPDAGQTKQVNREGLDNTYLPWASSSAPGTLSTAMGWTLNSGACAVQLAIPLKP